PDGKRLATCDDRECLVWDVATGRLLRRFRAESPTGFADVAFSGDGQRLVACSFSARVTVWEVATGRKAAEWQSPAAKFPGGARFTAGGKVLIWGAAIVNFCLEWDPATGREERRLAGPIVRAATPDG